MDDERLKNLGGGGYWKELLQRIRDIRASEKVFYRQVLDIYATSIDYDPKADVSIAFFKKVQNKIHYAVHGHTAAEVIFNRADAEKQFMGLMTFPGNRPYLKDVVVAKNYLNEKELRALGQIVSGYLDFAERQADRKQAMRMNDWAAYLDRILTMSGEKLLQGAGLVSHDKAVEKATIKTAFNQIQTYKSAISTLFTYNVFTIISDGLEAKAGTISAGMSRFMSWKSADGKEEASNLVSQLETLISGMLKKRNLAGFNPAFCSKFQEFFILPYWE